MHPSQLPESPDAGGYPMMEGVPEDAWDVWPELDHVIHDVEQLHLQDAVQEVVQDNEQPIPEAPENQDPIGGQGTGWVPAPRPPTPLKLECATCPAIIW